MVNARAGSVSCWTWSKRWAGHRGTDSSGSRSPRRTPRTSTALITAWCERTGNELVAIDRQCRDGPARSQPRPVRRTRPTRYPAPGCGCTPTSTATSPATTAACCPPRRPTARPGRSTASASSPPKRSTPASRELILTGGEPFLLPDLDELVAACTDVLPTTLLTNGMLFQRSPPGGSAPDGPDRLTLQISLDSATAELHDRHRGPGSWHRAVTGSGRARGGLPRQGRRHPSATSRAHAVEPFHAFLETLGIPARTGSSAPSPAAVSPTQGSNSPSSR